MVFDLEGFFGSPALIDSAAGSFFGQIKHPDPIGQKPFLPAILEPHMIGLGSLIAALLRGGRPAAVARAVAATVVDAVKRVLSRRALAHVGQEVLEHTPTLADSNASAAVVVPVGIVGVRAALPHSDPRNVSGRPSESMPLHSIGCVAGKAPATSCMPSTEPVRLNKVSVAAGTTTLPNSLIVSHNGTNGGQTPKCLTSNINAEAIPGRVAFKTTAGLGVPTDQFTRNDSRFVPAFTPAQPTDFLGFCRRLANNGKAIERNAGKVFECWHELLHEWGATCPRS